MMRKVIRGRNKRKNDKDESKEEMHMQQVYCKYSLLLDVFLNVI